MERAGGREGRAAGALELEQMGVSTGAAAPGPHAPLWPQGICWAGEGSQRQPGASWTASGLTGHRDGQGGGPHSALYPVTFGSNSRGQDGARPLCGTERGWCLCVGSLRVAVFWEECVGSWYLAEPGIQALGSCLNGPGITGSF